MKWVASLVCMSAAVLASAGTSQAGNCPPCGGCSDPCASGATTVSAGCGGAAAAGNPVFDSTMVGGESLCDTVTSYRVVMEPKYVTETRIVSCTVMKSETRQRAKTCYKTVPVTETKYRHKIVNVPRTETKSFEYTVLIPVKTEKEIEVSESVPVWNEKTEEYTVRVPVLVDQPEEYTVKVPALQEQSFTYTVNVPQALKEQKVRTVVNAVPVTKSRTVQVCVPTTTMQTVTRDYGHWEDQLVEVDSGAAAAAAGSCGPGMRRVVVRSSGRRGLFGRRGGTCYTKCVPACGGCGSCGSCAPAATSCGGCGVAAGAGGVIGAQLAAGVDAGAAAGVLPPCAVTKRVWVPNVVTESIPVQGTKMADQVVNYTVYEQRTHQIPYECTRIVYVPEQRTGTRKVCVYNDEKRTRMRKVVQYNNEPRTRTRKQLTYTTVTRKEKVPHITYKTEKRTKEVSYTYNVPECTTEAYEVCRYDRVAEHVIEDYTVCVPVCVQKEQQVQVCKMVPRLVEETINPCMCGDADSSASGAGAGCGGAAGCGCAAPAPCSSCK